MALSSPQLVEAQYFWLIIGEDEGDEGIIDDIAFELFAMHCGIGKGIRQKKIPQEKWSCRKYNKLIVSLEGPHRPECICFFLNAISSFVVKRNNLRVRKLCPVGDVIILNPVFLYFQNCILYFPRPREISFKSIYGAPFHHIRGSFHTTFVLSLTTLLFF